MTNLVTMLVEISHGDTEREKLISEIGKLLEEAEKGRLPHRRIGDIYKLRFRVLHSLARDIFSQISYYGSRIFSPRQIASILLQSLVDSGFRLEESLLVLGYDLDIADLSTEVARYVPLVADVRLISISQQPIGLVWRTCKLCTEGRIARVEYPIFVGSNVLVEENLCLRCDKFEQCEGKAFNDKKCVRRDENVPVYSVEVGILYKQRETEKSYTTTITALAFPHVVDALREMGEGRILGIVIDRYVTRKGYRAIEPILLILDTLTDRLDTLEAIRRYLQSRGYVLINEIDPETVDVDTLASSICPELVKCHPQRVFALLQAVGAYSTLFTGVRHGHGKRCVIHELHVGAPGQGKSTIYSALRCLVPRSIYTTVTSSTVAGLFISGKEEIRYGGAVLASSTDPTRFGLIILDEVDTIRDTEKMGDILSQLLMFMEQGTVSRNIQGRDIELHGLNGAVAMLANIRKLRVRKNITLADLLPDLFLRDGKGDAILDRIDIIVFYPPAEVEDLKQYLDNMLPSRRSNRGLVVDPETLQNTILYARKVMVEVSDRFIDVLKNELESQLEKYRSLGLSAGFLSYRAVDKIIRLCVAYAKLEYAIGIINEPVVTEDHYRKISYLIDSMLSSASILLEDVSPFSVVPEHVRTQTRGLNYPFLGGLVLTELSAVEDGLTIEEIYDRIVEKASRSQIILSQLLGELGLARPDPQKIKDAIVQILEKLASRGDVYKVSGYGYEAKYRIVRST